MFAVCGFVSLDFVRGKCTLYTHELFQGNSPWL